MPSVSRRPLHSPAAHETASGVANPAPAAERQPTEIIVGWMCIVIGLLLELIMPRAVFVYLPFFAGSLAMGIRLFMTRRVLHALILVLCTCIPAPLLRGQSLRESLFGLPAQARSTLSRTRKLVFEGQGQPKLVAVEEEAPAARPAPPAPIPARPGTPSPAPASWNDPGEERKSAEGSPQPKVKVIPTEDAYRELIENSQDIPPLIPEDVLASTKIGRGPDFLWQESDIPAAAGLPAGPPPLVAMPFVVYSDIGAGTQATYVAGGTLGNQTALQVDEAWAVGCHAGTTCVKLTYDDVIDWVTLAWQSPAHNWGDMAGGFDLSRARRLTFWARGESGNEKVEFFVGMEQPETAVSRDSLRASTGIVRLPDTWKKYSIHLTKLDRSRLITGFGLRIEGQGKPVVFFLDDIRYEL